MKLNHINLTSTDVPADVSMFETYFGLRTLVMRGKALAVIHDDDDGMLLVLNDFAKKRGSFAYPENSDVHHIGFIQDSREEVDALNARLKADGWDVPEPRDYHGAWTFYFKAKGGYFIEVATRTQLRRAEAAAV
ncbi:VOC family protein [Methylobacterium sp. E-005]|uniref:VOC family protein n=1 Tax=Methylobacterium sp. E-005 TaxID=2836549 RepID=UPI001FB9A386|nr:VOC family protein [Methylobacterium sp. E-005]MCJ2085010.1 VOC family protein [Methylobacterium sp. E-005]